MPITTQALPFSPQGTETIAFASNPNTNINNDINAAIGAWNRLYGNSSEQVNSAYDAAAQYLAPYMADNAIPLFSNIPGSRMTIADVARASANGDLAAGVKSQVTDPTNYMMGAINDAYKNFIGTSFGSLASDMLSHSGAVRGRSGAVDQAVMGRLAQQYLPIYAGAANNLALANQQSLQRSADVAQTAALNQFNNALTNRSSAISLGQQLAGTRANALSDLVRQGTSQMMQYALTRPQVFPVQGFNGNGSSSNIQGHPASFADYNTPEPSPKKDDPPPGPGGGGGGGNPKLTDSQFSGAIQNLFGGTPLNQVSTNSPTPATGNNLFSGSTGTGVDLWGGSYTPGSYSTNNYRI